MPAPDAVDASMARTCANEVAIRVTNQALPVFGGHGCLTSMCVERYLRGARFGALGGDTPQIQRDIIARSLLRRAER